MGVHKGIKYFKCKDCDKAFTYVHKLKRHARVAHEGVKLKCEFCGKDLKPECLKSHILSVHSNGIKQHKCETCGKSFALKSTLSKHISGVHKGIRRFECDICGKL